MPEYTQAAKIEKKDLYLLLRPVIEEHNLQSWNLCELISLTQPAEPENIADFLAKPPYLLNDTQYRVIDADELLKMANEYLPDEKPKYTKKGEIPVSYLVIASQANSDRLDEAVATFYRDFQEYVQNINGIMTDGLKLFIDELN